ncbi:MAG TPA: EAL domain-containing protein [Streptosporangiaceae bacterium]|nr:EAL domain-containing protein [Streptosporangiaceae bacterium]
MKSRRYALGGYTVWIALLIGAYYWLHGLRVEAWGLIGLSGVTAIVTGVVINRPTRKLPWLLLAAALASFTAGQMSFLVAQLTGTPLPFPSYADALYLLTYPLYAAGLAIFIWWRTPDGDRRSLIDALTLTVGMALLSWIYLVAPYVHNSELSWLQKSVAIAYPLGDVLVLAMLARLLAPGARQSRCVQLLTLGAVGTLVSDTAYGLIELHGVFHNGTVVDLGWAVFYSAWGAAALHPTMTDLTKPVTRLRAEVSPIRLIMLMLASLIAPAVLFGESFRFHGSDLGVIAVFSAALYLLVLWRLSDVAASHRRALGRERVVRQAGVSLVAAASVDQVAAAVKSAADALLGPLPDGDVLLAVRTDGTFRAVSQASADPALMSRLAEQTETWLPLVTASAPLLAPVTSLPGQARAFAPGSDWMLLCPLTVKDRPSGDPLIGVLAVFDGERMLADLFATMEILAHQVALAVERILLRDEVIRRENEAYFRTLVQDTSDAILIVGDEGTVRYATPSATTIFGDITVEGGYLWDLVADGERDDLVRTLMLLRAGASLGSRYVDHQITRRDGVTVQVQLRCSDLRDDPTVAGLVLTLRDVTEQRKLESELKHHAFHDALTGLPNRLLFQDRISQQLAAARRDDTAAGVLFVDVDDFKVVNDTMGHSVGDELLVATAERLSGLIRDADTAARLGGDEFALLIGNVADSGAVEAAADRLVRVFSEPFALASGAVLATVTVGVATTEDSADTDELLRHADLALYAAKAAGKRQWRRYQPMLSAGLVKRRELQAALEEAVATSAFTLAYQPIVALTTGELAGFEALVRWPHPQWGMMQPEQFIALAEETGQIVPLGSWVLAQAAADIARWRRDPRREPAARDAGSNGRAVEGAKPRRGPYISVNVSARQFSAPGFVDGVRRILDTSGLEPGALMLELTESVLLRRDERVQSDLMQLKSVGIRLAIDDFGTGYSSLSYLRELPIDVLKIDKSFVDGIASSTQRLALAEGIVQIARTLELDVIAEGIETELQRDLLVSMGCQYGQGYLLAMPMEAHRAEALARIGSRTIPTLPRQAAEPGTAAPAVPAPG